MPVPLMWVTHGKTTPYTADLGMVTMPFQHVYSVYKLHTPLTLGAINHSYWSYGPTELAMVTSWAPFPLRSHHSRLRSRRDGDVMIPAPDGPDVRAV